MKLNCGNPRVGGESKAGSGAHRSPSTLQFLPSISGIKHIRPPLLPPARASANNASPFRNNSQNKEQGIEIKGNSFKGTYAKIAATASSSSPSSSTSRAPSSESDSDSWEVYPLTTLHDSTPAPAAAKIETAPKTASSWPSAAARKALYNDIPVERCDGIYLPIYGKLPTWLKGSLYRNGPGHFKGAHAVFDGCAMIARFKIDGSELSGPSVVVSHRFIETTYLAAARAAGGDVRWTLGHKTGVKRTPLERLKYLASLGAGALAHGVHLGDNALISIFPGAATTASGKKELIAHTETLSGTYRIDPDTLETLGRVEAAPIKGTAEEKHLIGGEKVELSGEGVSGLGKTAHPHVLRNGDVINLACDFMPVASKAAGARLFRPPHMTLYRNPGGDPTRREAIAHIPYLRPSSPTWVHQVAVSHNYAVIVQNPCFYGIDNMVFGESGEYLVFRWEPSAGSLIHVVPLHNNYKKTKEIKNMSMSSSYQNMENISSKEGNEEGGGSGVNDENVSDSSFIKPRLDRIKSFRAPAFLATHWINAFESDDPGGANASSSAASATISGGGGRGGTTTNSSPSAGGRYLNLDGCMTKDPRLMAHWSLENVRSGLVKGKQIDISVMRRLVIDLDAPDGSFLGSGTGGSGTNVLNDSSFLQKLVPDAAHGYAIELPAINNNFSGRQHQFVYAAAAHRPSNCWNALTKADVAHGTVKMWYETGAVCWEPLFVPRPGAVLEDDGVVLSVVTQADGKSALLVLDGQSFSEIARAVLPYGLSNGFHGCFVPED